MPCDALRSFFGSLGSGRSRMKKAGVYPRSDTAASVARRTASRLRGAGRCGALLGGDRRRRPAGPRLYPHRPHGEKFFGRPRDRCGRRRNEPSPSAGTQDDPLLSRSLPAQDRHGIHPRSHGVALRLPRGAYPPREECLHRRGRNSLPGFRRERHSRAESLAACPSGRHALA